MDETKITFTIDVKMLLSGNIENVNSVIGGIWIEENYPKIINKKVKLCMNYKSDYIRLIWITDNTKAINIFKSILENEWNKNSEISLLDFEYLITLIKDLIKTNGILKGVKSIITKDYNKQIKQLEMFSKYIKGSC